MDLVWNVNDELIQSLSNEHIKKFLVLNNQYDGFDNRDGVKKFFLNTLSYIFKKIF